MIIISPTIPLIADPSWANKSDHQKKKALRLPDGLRVGGQPERPPRAGTFLFVLFISALQRTRTLIPSMSAFFDFKHCLANQSTNELSTFAPSRPRTVPEDLSTSEYSLRKSRRSVFWRCWWSKRDCWSKIRVKARTWELKVSWAFPPVFSARKSGWWNFRAGFDDNPLIYILVAIKHCKHSAMKWSLLYFQPAQQKMVI